MFFVIGIIRGTLWLLQCLPLEWVARLGRWGGTLAWWFDRRHRRIALENLTAVFGAEKSSEEIRAIARENLCRLGENYASAIKTSVMDRASLDQRVQWSGSTFPKLGKPFVIAAGHFGNFELLARPEQHGTGWQVATTYRALPNPQLNRLMQSLRERSGTRYFERRHEARELMAAMKGGNTALGLLSDQHAGDKGLWLPFFGRECSVHSAPAVFALRYDTPLLTAICFRTGFARWRVEVGGPIPTRNPDGSNRSIEAITCDVNRVFEEAIRRDPANWFWVHRRWKPASAWQRKRTEHERSDA